MDLEAASSAQLRGHANPIQNVILAFYKQLSKIFDFPDLDPRSLYSIFLAEKTCYLLSDQELNKVVRVRHMQKRRITPLVQSHLHDR